MDNSKVSHGPVQLNLFHPRPTLPRWIELPTEVREPVCELLAQMLSAYLADQTSESQEKEFGDE